MKEFSFNFDEIFKGLQASLGLNKRRPELSECHNLVPTGVDFTLHTSITDLNADGISWDGSGAFLTDIWEDHSDDDFDDHSDDEFLDS